MEILIGWLLIALFLALVLGRVFRRAPFAGAPREAMRFFLRFREVLLEQHPEIEIQGLCSEGFGCVLSLGRQEVSVPLSQLYLREKAFPSAFKGAVGQLVVEVREHLTAVEELALDQAMGFFLPQIRPVSWVREHSPAFGPGALAQKELFDDLCVCYVIDAQESMRFVTLGHLRAWGLGLADLDNLAMRNLRALAAEDLGVQVPEQEGDLALTSSGDGYDAARLLLLLDEEKLDRAHGLVFAVPDRDLLVTAVDDGDLSALMQDVRIEHEHAAHPLSSRIYRVGASGLAPVDPDGK